MWFICGDGLRLGKWRRAKKGRCPHFSPSSTGPLGIDLVSDDEAICLETGGKAKSFDQESDTFDQTVTYNPETGEPEFSALPVSLLDCVMSEIGDVID
jgi:hypothetical protein